MDRPLKELDKVKVNAKYKAQVFEQVLEKTQKTKGIRVRNVAMTMLTMVFALFVGWNTVQINLVDTQAIVGSVAMDATSVIILNVDSENQVVSVEAVNEETKLILEGLQFEGKELEAVMVEIIDLPVYQQYLEQGILEVSFYSEDESTAKNIDEIVQQVFNQRLQNQNCHSRRVGEESWNKMMQWYRDHGMNGDENPTEHEERHQNKRMH